MDRSKLIKSLIKKYSPEILNSRDYVKYSSVYWKMYNIINFEKSKKMTPTDFKLTIVDKIKIALIKFSIIIKEQIIFRINTL